MMKQSTQQSDTYKIHMTGWSANFFISLLIATSTSIIPILLNSSQAIFYTSLPFYITIVILFVCVICFGGWGILASFLTYLLYGAVLELPFKVFMANTLVNTLEIWLMLMAYRRIKQLKTPNKNSYAKGSFYLSPYNSFLIIIFLTYLALCMFGIFKSNSYVLYTFFGVTALLTIIKICKERDLYLLYYTLFIALIPSALSCLISILLVDVPSNLVVEYFNTWTLSNYILIQTCGYICYQLLFTKRTYHFEHKSVQEIDASTLAYYASLIVWNVVIIYLFHLNLFNLFNLIYFFPWALGNIFLSLNLIFSRYNDAGNVENKFDWYEKRAIVVENNTSGIITIISLLLPVSASLLENIPPVLLVLFVVNIFCACLAVGLIWVPANNVRFMAFLKTLKTIFFLFAISFLMLSVIMIMFSPKKKDYSYTVGYKDHLPPSSCRMTHDSPQAFLSNRDLAQTAVSRECRPTLTQSF